jgi:hypothetical protein
MAQATTTTPGTIVLAGDLTGGSAYSPQLAPTGVNPGENAMYRKMYVDSKGRTVWISPSLLDLPVIGLASTTAYGKVKPDSSFTISNGTISTSIAGLLPTCSTSVKGIMQVGTGLSVTNGTISIDINALPIATTSVKGIMQVGTGLSESSGTISLDAPEATISSKGIVQIADQYLNVSSGVVSLDTASLPIGSTSQLGVLQTGTGLSSGNGILTLTVATTSSLGLVTIGDNLTITGPILSLENIATSSTAGIVQPSNPFEIAVDGTLSVNLPDGTDSQKGILQVGSGLVVSNGVVSVDTSQVATTSVNGFLELPSSTDLAFATSVKTYVDYNGDTILGLKPTNSLRDTIPYATSSTKGRINVASIDSRITATPNTVNSEYYSNFIVPNGYPDPNGFSATTTHYQLSIENNSTFYNSTNSTGQGFLQITDGQGFSVDSEGVLTFDAGVDTFSSSGTESAMYSNLQYQQEVTQASDVNGTPMGIFTWNFPIMKMESAGAQVITTFPKISSTRCKEIVVVYRTFYTNTSATYITITNFHSDYKMAADWDPNVYYQDSFNYRWKMFRITIEGTKQYISNY